MSLPYALLADSLINSLGEAATFKHGTSTATTISAVFGTGQVNVSGQDNVNVAALVVNIRFKASAVTGSPAEGDLIGRTATGDSFKLLSVEKVMGGAVWLCSAQRVE